MQKILKVQRYSVEGIFLLCLALLILVYQDTIISLYHLWYREDNPTYSHGLLLLGISVYLFVQRWRQIKHTIQLQLNLFAVSLVLLVSVLWMFSSLGDIQVAQQSLVLSLVLLLVYALFGRDVMIKLAFPFFLMICAIPIWEVANDSLRQIAVVFVTLMLNVSGFLVISEGYNILVPAGVFKVDAGCSGLNQFIVACAVGLLYAYIRRAPGQGFTYSAIVSFIVAIGIALLFAVLANIVRIYIVVVAGQLTNMQHYFVTTDHVMLGWVVFAAFMFGYFFLMDRIVFERLPGVSARPDVGASNSNTVKDAGANKKIVQLVLVAIALLLGPAYLSYLLAQSTLRPSMDGQVINLPSEVKHWHLKERQGKPRIPNQWHPNIQGADLFATAQYSSPAGSVELFVYHYYIQYQGKEAVHESNRLTNDVWRAQSAKAYTVAYADHAFEVQESLLSSPWGDTKLVWDWYYIDGVRTASPYSAKLRNIWGIVTGRPEITRFVLALDGSFDGSDGRERLRDFLEDSLSELERLSALHGSRSNKQMR